MSDARRAFTLIELMVVIVILAVLVGIALPKFLSFSDDARIRAAQAARGALVTAAVNAKLNDAVLNGGDGNWPADLTNVLIDDDGDAQLNPYWVPSIPVFEAEGGDPDQWHPREKTIEDAVAGGLGAIWYNPDNGQVRFRVPEQDANPATIAFYNLINFTDANSLNQTKQ